MSSPFDELAAETYEAAWSATPKGRGQRTEVWKVVDELFRPGDRVLDLGCGIGDDAIHFRERGIEVVGIDSSQEMVKMARSRNVDAHAARIQDLVALPNDYSGALSNFGALNCVEHLEPVAQQLGRLVRDRGYIALCVMGMFSWRESMRYLLERKPTKATRRWWGKANWRGTVIRYWSGREMRRAFDPQFEFRKRVAVGRGDHQLYIFQRRPL